MTYKSIKITMSMLWNLMNDNLDSAKLTLFLSHAFQCHDRLIPVSSARRDDMLGRAHVMFPCSSLSHS